MWLDSPYIDLSCGLQAGGRSQDNSTIAANRNDDTSVGYADGVGIATAELNFIWWNQLTTSVWQDTIHLQCLRLARRQTYHLTGKFQSNINRLGYWDREC